MKRVKLAAAAAGVAAIAATLSLASAGSSGEPADGLVFDAISAPVSVSYQGTVEVVRMGNHPQASVYRIEHRAPNLTERVYVSPPSLHGDSMVYRGPECFAVDLRRHRVVQSQNQATDDQIARDGNYLLLRANYRAVKRAPETFDGRAVVPVSLINKYTSRTIVLLRIDATTKLVLDKQQFSSDGSLASEMRFDDVRYAKTLPDADFTVPKQFAVVRGVSVGEPSSDVAAVVRGAGFAARSPKFLPDGFSPVEGHMIVVKRVPTLHLLYSDGIRTVSLFEDTSADLDLANLNPQPTTVGGRQAFYAEQGPTTLLTWTDGTLHYTLVGDLQLDEIQKIAASIYSY
jgi:negative regulator of sigma E activity